MVENPAGNRRSRGKSWRAIGGYRQGGVDGKMGQVGERRLEVVIELGGEKWRRQKGAMAESGKNGKVGSEMENQREEGWVGGREWAEGEKKGAPIIGSDEKLVDGGGKSNCVMGWREWKGVLGLGLGLGWELRR